MYKAKTFTLGAVSSTFSRGEHPLFRSKPRPFLVDVPSSKDNGNVINTHMTPSKSGEYEQRRSCAGRISPVKSWGLALFAISYILMIYVSVRGHLYTLWQHCTKGINSHFKNKWEDFTVKVQQLASTLELLLCSLEDAGDTPGDDC